MDAAHSALPRAAVGGGGAGVDKARLLAYVSGGDDGHLYIAVSGDGADYFIHFIYLSQQ
jgi:hypothetical protein